MTETTPPDPLVLPQDEFEMVKRLWQMLSTPSPDHPLAALDRAVERMRTAEGKLAAIADACRQTRCSPGCVGHSMDAADILAIIGSEEPRDG